MDSDQADSGESAADIILQLVYNSPGEWGCEDPGLYGGTILFYDYSRDLKKRVVITDLPNLNGLCLWARVRARDGNSLRPDGEGDYERVVHRAYYLEDGDRECAENLGQCSSSCSGQDPGCVE